MIVFENEGLIDMRAATIFGVSVKETDNPIGHFGTGLKYAIAVILREGGSIAIHRGCRRHEYRTLPRRIRGQPMKLVSMNGAEMPFTLEFGKGWEGWQAFRELYCNALDEGGRVYSSDEPVKGQKGMTRIVVEGADFDALYTTRDKIFLESEALYNLDGVEVHKGESRIVFYRGLRAHELKKPALFTYNITHSMTLTEDRTLKYGWMVPTHLVQAIVTSDCAEVIDAALSADRDYFEHSIDYGDASQCQVSPAFLRTAAKIKQDNRKMTATAHKLFTDTVRSAREARSYTTCNLSAVEWAIVKEAHSLLQNRCPNFPVYEVVPFDDEDLCQVTFEQLRLSPDVIHKGAHSLAKQILLATASKHCSDHSPMEWLADIILNTVAQVKAEAA